MVYRTLALDKCSWRITTVSTRCPSCNWIISLKPPESEFVYCTTLLVVSEKSWTKAARRSLGRSDGSLSNVHSSLGARATPPLLRCRKSHL